MRRAPRRGVSLVDVLVVIALIAMLIALWAPTVSKARERSDRYRCMNHLGVINQALSNYRNMSQGYPRVIYAPGAKPDVSGKGATAPDPFKAGGPPSNNVPAAFFLLLRTQDLDPQFMVCPSGGFKPETFGGTDENWGDPSQRSNFTDVRTNLGYSFLFTYTDQVNNASGRPVAADLNPGVTTVPAVSTQPVGSGPADALRQGNSNNHKRRGQNVLFDNGRVEWVTTPFVNADNMYLTQKGTVVDTPANQTDTILLPAEK